MGVEKLAKNFAKQVLVNINNKRYEKKLSRCRISYHQWITDLEDSYCVGAGVQENHQQRLSEEDFADRVVLFCNPKGRLARHAKAWIQKWFAQYPEAVLLYGDEDVWRRGEERSTPCFKPDWSPDLLETQFYLGSLVAVRKEWLERQSGWQTPGHQEGAPGDCRQMVYRLAELAGGFEKGRGRNTILHIPRILFHCDREEDQKRWLCYEEHSAEEHTARSLSVIIPSKDNPDLLEKCIRSVLNTASELQYEIVVVDNGSAAAEKRRIEALLERLRQSGMPGLGQLYYLYEPMEFNFSRMCNLGAERASGELLLFLNDDVELAAPESLRSMVRLAARPYTGAVGLKLLYPDDKAQGRIQHAGIVNLPMGPVHKLQFGRDEQVYYFGWNRGRHNALAVTAACLVVEKRKFQEVGGFDEALAVAFNDVDLCFRLYEQGYENVCECDSYAFHDESYSRGADESAEKLARLLAERRKLYERHPSLEGKDPYYSIYLNRQELDTCIRPAYETQGDFVQKVQKRQVSVDSGQKMQAYRQDNCLMVCVESVLETGDRFSGAPGTAPEKGLIITGWSVVLGDNNACYEKRLVLQRAGVWYTFPLQGQYRADLVENMSDQQNVGLGGYRVELAEGVLPAGAYRVGIGARNRVTGMRLINWSNRMVEI